MSTRSAALGEAGVGYLAGSSAFHLNPAGLAREPAAASGSGWGFAGEASLVHHEALGDLRQDAVVVDLARGREAIALSFNTLYSEDIEETDEVGNRTGSFGLVDLAAQLGFARRMSEAWRFGVTAGYVRERVGSSSAGTWAASAGALWDVGRVPGLSLGAAVRNVGGSPRFDLDGGPGETVDLPLTAQAGAAFARSWGASVNWRLLADIRKARDEDATGHVGLELGWQPVALRVGSRLGTDLGHFTAGIGLETGRLRFDYAFLPTGEVLGTSHRAELSARFSL